MLQQRPPGNSQQSLAIVTAQVTYSPVKRNGDNLYNVLKDGLDLASASATLAPAHVAIIQRIDVAVGVVVVALFLVVLALGVLLVRALRS